MNDQVVDYFSILGVRRDCTTEEVKHAFRQKAFRLHPDTGQTSDSEQFIKLHEAYEFLLDEKKRESLRRKLELRDTENRRRRCILAHSTLDERKKTGRKNPDGLFNRRRFDDYGETAKTPPVSVEIVLNHVEARYGGIIELEFPVRVTCPFCEGTGAILLFSCMACHGCGKIESVYPVRLELPARLSGGEKLLFSLASAGLPGLFLEVRIFVEDY